MAPLYGASSEFRLPGERQSSRLRARNLGNDTDQYEDLSLPRFTRNARHDLAPRRLDPVQVDLDAAEDDDDFEGAAESEDDGVTFRRRACLPESSVQKWKLSDIVDSLHQFPLSEKIDNGLIDLNPEYQRDIVWIAKSMSHLINSLIEDFYIPPLIFNLTVFRQPDGNERFHRVCVDGKQRLSSVHAFMKGKIPCLDKWGKEWYYCEAIDEAGQVESRGYKQRKRRIWSEEMRREFRNKSFVSYEFRDLNKMQEEDLFARVQKGMPLTAPEKLQASSGPWQDLAKRFERQFSNVVNLSKDTRGIGFRNLLTSFSQILEIRNPSNHNGEPAMKIQMPSVTRLATKGQDMCTPDNKRHLEEVFVKFSELVNLSLKTFQNNNYKVAKNFAPIELVAVAVLLSVYMDSRNNTMLLGDIEAMREAIRQHLPDLRMDNVTWKTIWQYINELESFRGAIDGTTTKKKNFTPKRVTNREKSRIKPVNQPVPQAMDVISSPSTHASARSTPTTSRATPTSSKTSNPSIIHTESPVIEATDRSALHRSPSYDSVLGDPADSQVSESTVRPLSQSESVVVPVWEQSAAKGNPDRTSAQVSSSTADPIVKVERDTTNSTSHKRPLSTGLPSVMTSFSAEIRAQRAKRVRLPSYRNADAGSGTTIF